MTKYVFSSESVAEGHPDKICDQISDSILDAYLAENPEARVALETLATTNKVVLAGEVRGAPKINAKRMEEIVRDVVKDIGYEQDGFHWKKLSVENFVHEQSADIALGVDVGAKKEEGAGDQGLMFGYACNETPELMPAPILYAHKILKNIRDARKSGKADGLGPDAKSQVSVKYENGKPVGIKALVLSTQHDEDLDQKDVQKIVLPIIKDSLPSGWFTDKTILYINPTGRFVIGGPDGDTGLTGRKIIVDTYGGSALHGGGAFSGKDPTKVDRSAAYAARYLAKNVVAAGIVPRCTIQIAYAIGIPEPVSVYVNVHGADVDHEKLSKVLQEMVHLSPRGIREHLDLCKPIYRPTASYGHFGRAPEKNGAFSWEKTDLADELASLFSTKVLKAHSA